MAAVGAEEREQVRRLRHEGLKHRNKVSARRLPAGPALLLLKVGITGASDREPPRARLPTRPWHGGQTHGASGDGPVTPTAHS